MSTPCERQRAREWYRANRDVILARRKQLYQKNPLPHRISVRKYAKANRERLKAYYVEYNKTPARRADHDARNRKRRLARQSQFAQMKLDRGCEDCGYRDHHYALDFAHRDPLTKIANIASMSSKAWDVVLEEMAKCRVLCRNCHAMETYEKGHNTGRRGHKRVARVAASQEPQQLSAF